MGIILKNDKWNLVKESLWMNLVWGNMRFLLEVKIGFLSGVGCWSLIGTRTGKTRCRKDVVKTIVVCHPAPLGLASQDHPDEYMTYPLLIFHIAIEHGHFKVEFFTSKVVIFHCHVWLPEANYDHRPSPVRSRHWIFGVWKMARVDAPACAGLS